MRPPGQPSFYHSHELHEKAAYYMTSESPRYKPRPPRNAVGLEGWDFLDNVRYTAYHSSSLPRALHAARNAAAQNATGAHMLAMGPPPAGEIREHERSMMDGFLSEVLVSTANSGGVSGGDKPRRSLLQVPPKVSPRRAHFVDPVMPPRMAMMRLATPEFAALDNDIRDEMSPPAPPPPLPVRTSEPKPHTPLAAPVDGPTASAIAEDAWANTALIHSPRSTYSRRAQLAGRSPRQVPRLSGVLARLPADMPAELLQEYTSAGLSKADPIDAFRQKHADEDDETPRDDAPLVVAAAPSDALALAPPTPLASWLAVVQPPDATAVGHYKDRKMGVGGSVKFQPGPVSRW